ncbi:MAG: metallophosphoesterase [Clostridia bacterium]|nr:metallophosphoesterase [Clostridia bacterium]
MSKNTNTLRFRPDGSFTVLQVSDPQDLAHPRKAMLQMLERAYDGLKPDLVLFTGDNILGNHLLDCGPLRIETVHDSRVTLFQMRRALRHILAPVNDRKIPFAMIYGNHDDANDVSKEEQFSLFTAYDHCLKMNPDDKTVDCDTYNIPILSADGSRTAWNLYMLDSAWNDETGQYWRIKEETVRWYNETSGRLRVENGGKNVPSLLFLHEALPQTRLLCKPCAADHPGAVRTREGYLCLDPAKAQGVLGEDISECEDPYGLFEAIKARGDVRAAVSGHDHANCFDGTVDGVRLIQSAAASFRCYGSRMRGVRLFTLHEDDPERFETQYFTYDALCGTGFRSQLRYFWDADDKTVEKYAFLGTGALLAAGAATAVCIRRLCARK